MADCQFIAFHGWGFHSGYWQPWEDHLSQYGTFQAYDRGYFSSPQKIEMREPMVSVCITHSFGLHWIPETMLDRTDLLVITSGFLCFHPYVAQYKRRSRMIVQEMINALEVNPEKVLREFHGNCFAPWKAPSLDFENLNHQLLLDDLRILQDSELDSKKLKGVGKICILHGTNDKIVPNKKGRQLYTQFQDRAQYFEIKDAGHALPFTHYEQGLDFITPEVVQLVESNTGA